MQQILNVLIFSGLAGFATIVGILLTLYYESWARKNSIYIISFAAGTLLAGAFFHIIPESLELYENAMIVVILGFLLFYLLENTALVHPCKEEDCPKHNFSEIAIIGLGFHSLLDGIAIGVGFEISTSLGLITTLAVLLHELPEGISAMGLMLHAKVERRRAVIFSLLVALATPLGALGAYVFLKDITLQILGILLSLAAGSFIYIAASDLVPETHREFRKQNALILIFGIVFVYLVGMGFG
ncbi:MAG: ZIP family metal transporter [Candidatus Methanofastidiosia archaeon]